MRKSARTVLGSIARLRSTLGAHCERLAAAASPAGVYDPVFDFFDAALEAAHRELSGAEHAYAAAQLEVGEVGREHRLAFAELHFLHAAVEGFCRSQPGLEAAGAVGPTPRDPFLLVRQAEETLEFLRVLESAPDAPVLTPGVGLDAGAVAGELAAAVPPLEDAIIALDRAKAKVVDARERAKRALAGGRRKASLVASLLSDLSGLVGEPGLAGRNRRSRG